MDWTIAFKFLKLKERIQFVVHSSTYKLMYCPVVSNVGTPCILSVTTNRTKALYFLLEMLSRNFRVTLYRVRKHFNHNI